MNMKKIIGTFIVACAGFEIYKILGSGKIEKYSSEWFESGSDEVLKSEREVVRQQYCSAGDNDTLAVLLENLLRRFDYILSKRAWAGQEPGFPKHGEHGWHLHDDD